MNLFGSLLPSAADSHHIDADPDPAFHVDAESDPQHYNLNFITVYLHFVSEQKKKKE